MQQLSLDVFTLCDHLGPAKVLHICVPAADLKAIVVVDNAACGPAIGGTRMAPDVSLAECARLARAMTLKNAAAGIPHGGAKSVILGDPQMPAADKEQTIRAFASAIEHLTDYIPGPDMGTDETESVVNMRGANRIPAEDLVAVPCDIWIPAARPDVLRADNVARMDCRLVLQAANIPATPEAEALMHERGIVNVPDFIANAGGVICAAVEFAGGTETGAFERIKEKVAVNTRAVLQRAVERSAIPRDAADELARERLERAMKIRRWH